MSDLDEKTRQVLHQEFLYSDTIHPIDYILEGLKVDGMGGARFGDSGFISSGT